MIESHFAMPGIEEKLYCDPLLGEIILRRNPRVKNLSIRIRGGRVVLTLPRWKDLDRGLDFLHKKKDWVGEKVEASKERIHTLKRGESSAETMEEIERMIAKARKSLPSRLSYLARKHSLSYTRVSIRGRSSTWGTCNTRKEISLNFNLVGLPVILQDYVILHELCHTLHMNHGDAFHAKLNELCCQLLVEYQDNYNRFLSERPSFFEDCRRIQESLDKGSEATPQEQEDLSLLEEMKVFDTLAMNLRRTRSSQPYRYVLEKEMKRYAPY